MNTTLTICSLVIGVLSKHFIDFVRSNKRISFLTEKDKKKVLAVAAILSTIGALLAAIATGNVTTEIVSSGLVVILTSVLSFASAVGYHEVVKRKKAKK